MYGYRIKNTFGRVFQRTKYYPTDCPELRTFIDKINNAPNGHAEIKLDGVLSGGNLPVRQIYPVVDLSRRRVRFGLS